MFVAPTWAVAGGVRVLLVGDSTMAPETGYGNALCGRFTPDVSCINLAKGGRSSSSYRAEGSWEQVRKLLQDGAGFDTTYVLIQFGHNDQPGKPGRSTDLATQFPVNMSNYVDEVKALHAIPVLVTPLSRRTFKQGTLPNDLRPWAEATIKVAAQQQVAVLDLNADSSAAVQAMGQEQADTLAMAPPPANPTNPETTDGKGKGSGYRGFDRTHLGAKGAALFSGMVAHELRKVVPALNGEFKSGD
jgi:lysophospholipase L1-like esterase